MNAKRPHGQLRRSQLVTTFGPGALVDLPKHSIIVGGLDHWFGGSKSKQAGDEIIEKRLVDKLRELLQIPELRLFTPPSENDDSTDPMTYVTGWQFPEWFVTQKVMQGPRGAVSRRLVHRLGLTGGQFIDLDKKKQPVVPVRFVRACPRGHIGDIDWRNFVHSWEGKCPRSLWMDERGTSGSDVWIRCDCKAERPMLDAFRPDAMALGNCKGDRPWLGPYEREKCGIPNRLLVRHASNAYFAHVMSVISLPDRDEELAAAVDQVWESHLQYVEDLDDLRYERKKKPPVQAALEGFNDDGVFEFIQSRKGASDGGPQKSVKRAELETLMASQDEIGNDRPDGRFFARCRKLTGEEQALPWMKSIDRVVLVHRLREVTAQVGFTRFESSAVDVEGELEMGVVRAPLARETTWLPAIENKGEGVFIAFRENAIVEWQALDAVQARGERLLAGFDCWKQDHSASSREFPGLPYVMLHSLSHLLITAISLECGYPASSIRERIYANSTGYGILLFTGSPDAEGTLGGLVDTGRHISRHLQKALEIGRLCSNDPVCAQHQPENTHERRFLHGAACHGCLLVAETCCEQFNDFLDRALVVPTVDNLGAEFFPV